LRKSCKHCGRIVPYDHVCPNKPKQFNKRTEAERGRYTNEWAKKSLEIKERSLFLCAVCRDKGRYVYDNLETHHIIPLRGRPELLLSDGNLICLCARCHEAAERGEIDAAYLMGLVMARDIPPRR
jgi:5-methylcytosine-specific restriction endonuclease McrA